MQAARYGFTKKERYGFNTQEGYGFIFDEQVNFCLVQGTDGTWYGAENDNFGFVDPSYTPLEQVVYSLKCNALGDFVMAFGAAGNEQVPDTNLIAIQGTTGTIALVWNETTTQYEGESLEYATEIIANYVLDEVLCMDVRILPNNFIWINFDLQRGTN